MPYCMHVLVDGRDLTKVFNNQLASILNLDKLAQNIMQFSRCSSKD